jgi:excisionase family DNA binding protein
MSVTSEFVTADELGRLLKVPKATVYYWVSRGEIPVSRFGKHLRFRAADVVESFERKGRYSPPSCAMEHIKVRSARSSSLKTRDANHADLQK